MLVRRVDAMVISYMETHQNMISAVDKADELGTGESAMVGRGGR